MTTAQRLDAFERAGMRAVAIVRFTHDVSQWDPERFHAVGLWYADFSQTTDDEVRELLDAAAQDRAPRERGQDLRA